MLEQINGNKTYIGFTNNLERRIRQHNSEIKGGAKYTAGKNWKFHAFITGFETNIQALQFEWAWKHIKKKRHGINGRLNNLKDLITRDVITNKCDKKISELPLVIYSSQNYSLPILKNNSIDDYKMEKLNLYTHKNVSSLNVIKKKIEKLKSPVGDKMVLALNSFINRAGDKTYEGPHELGNFIKESIDLKSLEEGFITQLAELIE